jgi:hypothetical protein
VAGPFEFVLDRLYADIPLPGDGNLTSGPGFVVALGYRVITILIAAVGLCYYLAARREVAAVMRGAGEDTQVSMAEGVRGGDKERGRGGDGKKVTV